MTQDLTGIIGGEAYQHARGNVSCSFCNRVAPLRLDTDGWYCSEHAALKDALAEHIEEALAERGYEAEDATIMGMTLAAMVVCLQPQWSTQGGGDAGRGS